MKYRLAAIFFALLIPLISLSKDKIISISKDRTEIKLPGYKVNGIINATGEAYYFGYRLSNANYIKEPLRFEEDITHEFENYLSPLFSQTGKEIYIRVNKIFHYEVLLEESMLVITDMNISFLEIGDTTFMELFRAAISLRESNSNIKNVKFTIDACLSLFNKRVREFKATPVTYPIDKLEESPLKEIDYESFIRNERKQKGVFWTYDDFFYNTPDTRSDITIDYKDRINRHDSVIIKHATLSYKKVKKDITNAWGFSDGSRTFVRVGNRYFPLLKQEDGFYLKFRVNSGSGTAAAAAIGGVLGGIIGGVALGVAVGFIPGSSGSGEQLLKLDLNSGSFDVFIEPGHKTIASTLIFYSPDKNDGTFELYFDDEFQCILPPDSWYKIRMPSTKKIIPVNLTDENENTFRDEIEPRLFQEDIYICYERKKKPPFFRKVTSQTTTSTKQQLKPENQIQ